MEAGAPVGKKQRLRVVMVMSSVYQKSKYCFVTSQLYSILRSRRLAVYIDGNKDGVGSHLDA